MNHVNHLTHNVSIMWRTDFVLLPTNVFTIYVNCNLYCVYWMPNEYEKNAQNIWRAFSPTQQSAILFELWTLNLAWWICSPIPIIVRTHILFACIFPRSHFTSLYHNSFFVFVWMCFGALINFFVCRLVSTQTIAVGRICSIASNGQTILMRTPNIRNWYINIRI